jgi:pyruvate dehydrogenase E2 component (dihydrolipoamide acetyltransferase)
VSELIRVPDIGSGEGEVIELFVKVGDRIEADQSILTLESDKASMEIPAPKAGVVKVKLGDRLKKATNCWSWSEGAAAAGSGRRPAAAPAAAAPAAEAGCLRLPLAPPPASRTSTSRTSVRRARPRSSKLLVKVGDTVEADQSLITLESDKASMEIPSPAAGVVGSARVKLEDEVGTGDLILAESRGRSACRRTGSSCCSGGQG